MSSRARVGEQIAEQMQQVIAAAVLTNERIARTIGLNVVDFQAYGVLLRHGDSMTPSQLAQVTQLPSSTITRVLDRLQAKDLVARRPDPADRRKVWVDTLPLDSAGVTAAYAEILRQMDEVHAGFSVAELQLVLRYLRAITDVR
jgi:DNA-binding MarR family transcriptional regulator